MLKIIGKKTQNTLLLTSLLFAGGGKPLPKLMMHRYPGLSKKMGGTRF